MSFPDVPPVNTLPSNSSVNVPNNSVSEAENTSYQQGTLNNTQINNTNNSLFQYSAGTRIPTDNINLSFSTRDFDDAYLTATYVHNFGRRARKLAEKEIETYNLGARVSICHNLIKSGVMVDTEAMPELAYCNAFFNVAPPEVGEDLSLIKAEIQALIEENAKLQELNKAAQDRINHIKTNSSVRTRG